MTPDRDLERVLEHWLVAGVDQMPDRVYRSVFDRVEREHQAVAPRLLRRIPTMSSPLRIAALVAALLVVVVGGTIFLGGAGGPAPGPTPGTTSPTPAAADPSLEPSYLPYEWPGALAAGTYSTSLAWDLPFAFTFTVPGGWSGYDIEVSKPGSSNLSVEFVLVDDVFADPCSGDLLDPPVGPSVGELADAIATIPGVEVTSTSPTQFDRWTTGTIVDYSIAADAGCAPEGFRLWKLSRDRVSSVEHFGGDVKMAVGRAGRIWILDVDGTRAVIRTTWDADATPDEQAELQSITDSIWIDHPEQPGASPPPAPAP